MDDTSSSRGNSNSILKIILAICVIAVVGLLVLGFFNKTKIDQLTDSLTETQKQVADVKKVTDESKQNLADEARDGAANIAGSIQDIENPAVRLALAKAYIQGLSSALSPADKQNLDTIVVYVEKNPQVLVDENPQLPQNVAAAVTALKTRVANLRNAAVATAQNIDEAVYSKDEVVTITGTLTFVEDDEVFGGSIFTLSDNTTGEVFYLHMNDANSQTIKNTMLDKTVTVDVKVTSSAGEPLTFQVIKGPTLVTQQAQNTPIPTATQ